MFRYEFVQPLIVKINYLLVRFKVLQSFSFILSQGVHRLFLDFCKVLTKVLNFFRANLHILAHLHRQINLRILQKHPFPSITIKPLQSLKQLRGLILKSRPHILELVPKIIKKRPGAIHQKYSLI
jgi:hypothetical protein